MRRTVAVLIVAFLVALAGCGGVAGPSTSDDATATAAPADGTPSDDVSTVTTDVTSTPEGDPTETPAGTADERVETPEGTLEVHFINLGQADSTLFIGPTGETLLVDTGDWRNDGATVIDYLESVGVDRIDYLVSTHSHADHIGGHAAVIEHFETEGEGVGAVYDSGVPSTSATYERYLDAVEEHDVTLYRTREGDEIPMEGVDVTVLNPPGPERNEDEDDLHYNSVSVRVEFEETSFLLTGDAEADAERRMQQAHGDALDATVYHAGHHGSRTSSSGEFLDAVSPEATVISSDYDSQYGHPHDETLDRFDARGIDAYWTGVHGTVVMRSDGRTVTVATQTDATTDAGDLRSESATAASAADPVENRTTYGPGADAERVPFGPGTTIGPEAPSDVGAPVAAPAARVAGGVR